MDTEDIKNMTTAYLQVLAEAKKKKDGMHKMPDGSMMKDDDPHMKEKKKLDPVDKNALKGDHDDREDGDIDNDGDTDASDEYLHNRRKTIKKSMKNDSKSETYKAQPKSQVSLAPNNPLDKMKPKKEMMKLKAMKNLYMNKKESADRESLRNEEVEDLQELSIGTLKNYIRRKVGRNARASESLKAGYALTKVPAMFDRLNKAEKAEIIKYLKDQEAKVKKAEKGIDLAKLKATAKADKLGVDLIFGKDGKAMGRSKISMDEEVQVAENRWPIYNKIMENRAMQTKGATEPEGMYSKSSEGEKAFIAMHTPNGAVDPRFDANVAAEKTAQSIANSVKPGTGNDAAGNAVPGDKAIRK